ncbi:hypothetical protein EU527_17575 [Candidatus Thorarchaeota archaeon]|nr:MAG: hypothetical protein EU527_17575 [Candidatus Thorarchaeota archaeon]
MVVSVSIINFTILSSITMNQAETNTQLTPWDAFFDLLSPILDPLIDIWENYALRVTILSTIIWSFLIICGLVFLVFEGGAILPLILGTKPKPISRTTQVQTGRRLADDKTGARQRTTQKTERGDELRSAQSIDETRVRVTSKIKKHYDKLVLNVMITNGSDSKIDMVVVDLDLPQGIEIDIGSFRMQRIGSIDSGQTESAIFALKSTGGNPESISGHVEFLGASYEVSKVPIPAPETED